MFVNDTSDMGLILRSYKEQVPLKQKDNSTEKTGKELNKYFSKEDTIN